LEGSANVTGFEYDRQLVISVGVSDFDSALAWYRDNLGFELVYKLDEYGWGEVKTPFGEDVTIGIGQTEEVRPGSMVPTFGVKDIDAARTARGERRSGRRHERGAREGEAGDLLRS
jgi:catechol 2,3-dioxygenase-like lactoylglutathione lyase family enzyme